MATPSGRVFTQQELNSIVAQERRDAAARYEGYDAYRSKAEQLDALLATAEPPAESSTDDGAADVGAPPEAPDAPETPAAAPGAAPERDAVLTENAALKTQLLRQQISAKQHLDPDLWDRVKGDTAEEIEADVRKLTAAIPRAGTIPPRGMQSGAGGRPDYRTSKEKAADALRNMSRSG